MKPNIQQVEGQVRKQVKGQVRSADGVQVTHLLISFTSIELNDLRLNQSK